MLYFVRSSFAVKYLVCELIYCTYWAEILIMLVSLIYALFEKQQKANLINI